MADATRTRRCIRCGEMFPVNPRERNPKRYCKQACRVASYRDDPNYKAEQNKRAAEKSRASYRPVRHLRRPCIECGALFEPTRSNNTVCSKRCSIQRASHRLLSTTEGRDYRRRQNARRRGTTLRERVTEFNCAWCGATRRPGADCAANASKFCGRACLKRWHDAGGTSRRDLRWDKARQLQADGALMPSLGEVWTAGHCRRCRQPYTSPPWQALGPFCSGKCRAGQRHSMRAKRKKISQGLRRRVYERDGWMCHICGDRVDQFGPPTTNWAPSLDHIVPHSEGGSDDESNLRCAHRWCNSVRQTHALDAAY